MNPESGPGVIGGVAHTGPPMLDRTDPSLAEAVSDSLARAADAGLTFVSEGVPGITRLRRGRAFAYRWPNGTPVRDRAVLGRIRRLAIPPAWTEVWISADASGHIQATGRDARGRKQYRYHAEWSRVRDEAKYGSLVAFGRSLAQIRATIRAHMGERGLGRQRVLATVAHLLDTTLIRVGNREYVRANKSFGLTTLEDRHVTFAGSEVRFRFRGKTGKEWRLGIADRRIARIVRSCQDLPGQHLFQYEDEAGGVRPVTSADVNAYLREIAGPEVSAKMFRTWAGTVLVSMALREMGGAASEALAKRHIRAAVAEVAHRLGNTAAICRRCYVHPGVLEAYAEGALVKAFDRALARTLKAPVADLAPEEAATLALLGARANGNGKG